MHEDSRGSSRMRLMFDHLAASLIALSGKSGKSRRKPSRRN
jgi:hypothetical protein